MRLVSDIDDIDALRDVKHKIYHFIREMSGYKTYESHVICCHFEHVEDLDRYWNEIVNYVSMSIQANVKQTIEAYNIYILFFGEDIDKNLRFVIEQDRYSSRKVVVCQEMPEDIEALKKLVEDRLYNISIPVNEQKVNDIGIYLREKDRELYTLVTNVQGRIQDISEDSIEKILNKLEMEA